MDSLLTFVSKIITLPCRIYSWVYLTFFTLDISKKGPVFVTGCDTGFGYLLALKLVRNGISTFAGCLTEAGETELRKAAAQAPGKLWTVQLNVTDQSSVDKAVDFVKRTLGHGKGLWGLVNNAGILGSTGPDDWLTVGDYHKTMDVNFFGVVRVTQAFKPLVKLERGRVVVVTSVFGRVAPAGSGPYIASKYAAESYCDVIRRELRPFGVSVHILEPGFFATSICDPDNVINILSQQWQKLPQHTKEEYGEDFYEKSVASIRKNLGAMCSTKLELVVDAYYDALTSRCPSLRYHVGADSKFLFIPLSHFPTYGQDLIVQLAEKMKGLPVPEAGLKNNA